MWKFFTRSGDEKTQQTPPVQPRRITGRISAAGAILAGTGFTVTHPGTGQYVVTFSVPFDNIPIVILSGVLVNSIYTVAVQTVNGFEIRTQNPSGTNTDSIWNFIVHEVM